MKKVKFENKLLESKYFEASYTYNNLAKMSLSTPPPKGIHISQMGDRIEAVKLFNNEKDVELSPAQLNLLISSFETVAWKFVDEKLKVFYEYIKELKEIF